MKRLTALASIIISLLVVILIITLPPGSAIGAPVPLVRTGSNQVAPGHTWTFDVTYSPTSAIDIHFATLKIQVVTHPNGYHKGFKGTPKDSKKEARGYNDATLCKVRTHGAWEHHKRWQWHWYLKVWFDNNYDHCNSQDDFDVVTLSTTENDSGFNTWRGSYVEQSSENG